MQGNLAICDDNQKILKSKISRRMVSTTPFESPVRSTVKGSIVGAKTGCPLSALLFVVSLDKSLKEIHEHAVRSLNIRDESRISPLPVAGYADDIAFVSLNEKLIKEMVQIW